MARGLRHLKSSVLEDLNQFLFSAWDQGARHLALRAEGPGTVLDFLGPDGRKHTEWWSLPYDSAVECLRRMGGRQGRVRASMGGQHWHFEPVISESQPAKVFLHLRPDED